MLDALRKLSTLPRQDISEPQPYYYGINGADNESRRNQYSSSNPIPMTQYSLHVPQMDSLGLYNYRNSAVEQQQHQHQQPSQYTPNSNSLYHPLSPLSPLEDGNKKRRMAYDGASPLSPTTMPVGKCNQPETPSRVRATPPQGFYYSSVSGIPPTPVSSSTSIPIKAKKAYGADVDSVPQMPIGYDGQNQMYTPMKSHNHHHHHQPVQGSANVLYHNPVFTTQNSLSQVNANRNGWKPRDIVLPLIVDTNNNYGGDDPHGHYVYQIGETFAGRYTIIKLLGQGTYGKVLQVWDNRQRELCALKIIKAIAKYREASKIELRVLAMLNRFDPSGSYKCVGMRGCFDYRNHVCIVTHLHDVSIYDFLKSNMFSPFPPQQIVSFARQILKSVCYIHSLGLVHTDLKPENMLLSSSEYTEGSYRRPRERTLTSRRELKNTEITLIDFGSSVFQDEYHSAVVSTRHYRAPEVVLGLDWSYACDMWSIACVLVELCTGRVLFETRDNLEHLHMMQKTLSTTFSPQQLSETEFSNSSSDLVDWSQGPISLAPLKDEASLNNVKNFKTIPQFLQKYITISENKKFWTEFLDFIYKLMELNPEDRLTAEEALNHPWLRY